MMAGGHKAPPAALVVDDEAALLMLLAETLRDAGFQVYEAVSGEAALKLTEAHPDIALMVSDIRMPGMSGYQVASNVRSLHPEMKILLMTGYTDEAIPPSLVDAGIKLVFKPLDLDDFALLASSMIDPCGGADYAGPAR